MTKEWVIETGQNVYQRRSDAIIGQEWPIKLRVGDVRPAERMGGRVMLLKEMTEEARGQSG